ncbi:MAG: class I SAM-dependent methyltransferase [Chloroflexi bacterium]|nr:class I SAM-dependent methyltransferase [Chloroflexota bacterium]
MRPLQQKSAIQLPPELQSSNYRKHAAGVLQRWLIDRFHQRLGALASKALTGVSCPLVLEVGCGEGFVLSALARRLPECRLLGLDVSGPALRAARLLGVEASLQCADALHLPLRDASCDLVLAIEVLEHLAEPWLTCAEMLRVARGPIIVSVPHQPYFSLANLLRGKNLPTLGDDPDHRQRWSAGRFMAELQERATIRRVVRSFPWLMVLATKGEWR